MSEIPMAAFRCSCIDDCV